MEADQKKEIYDIITRNINKNPKVNNIIKTWLKNLSVEIH